jgi:NADH-quinone oxidoreductase subunit A
MSSDFVPLIAIACFGAGSAILTLIVPKLLAPSKRHPLKEEPFECGQVPLGEGRIDFMMQYYAYILMFVAVDVISMFIFAWGVSYFQLGFQSALIITSFLAIIFVPLGYALYLAGRKELW